MCLLVENYPVFATDNDKRLEERKILGLRKFKKKDNYFFYGQDFKLFTGSIS